MHSFWTKQQQKRETTICFTYCFQQQNINKSLTKITAEEVSDKLKTHNSTDTKKRTKTEIIVTRTSDTMKYNFH